MPKMVEVKCQRCKQPFMAREADRKRGWGKFCSKSCKAIRQTQKTGLSGQTNRMSKYSDGAGGYDYYTEYLDSLHPFSSEALGQWE